MEQICSRTFLREIYTFTRTQQLRTCIHTMCASGHAFNNVRSSCRNQTFTTPPQTDLNPPGPREPIDGCGGVVKPRVVAARAKKTRFGVEKPLKNGGRITFLPVVLEGNRRPQSNGQVDLAAVEGLFDVLLPMRHSRFPSCFQVRIVERDRRGRSAAQSSKFVAALAFLQLLSKTRHDFNCSWNKTCFELDEEDRAVLLPRARENSCHNVLYCRPPDRKDLLIALSSFEYVIWNVLAIIETYSTDVVALICNDNRRCRRSSHFPSPCLAQTNRLAPTHSNDIKHCTTLHAVPA